MGKLLFETLVCDECGNDVTMHGPDEWTCDYMARKEGWVIGKTIRCPKCKLGKYEQVTLDLAPPTKPIWQEPWTVDGMVERIKQMVVKKKDKVLW
jgi:hypothetical protein